MKSYYFFGWKDLDRIELTNRIHELSGIAYEPHESSYVGEYELFVDDAQNKIEVLSDFKDEEGSIYDAPGYITFVEISGPSAELYEKIMIDLGGTELAQ